MVIGRWKASLGFSKWGTICGFCLQNCSVLPSHSRWQWQFKLVSLACTATCATKRLRPCSQTTRQSWTLPAWCSLQPPWACWLCPAQDQIQSRECRSLQPPVLGMAVSSVQLQLMQCLLHALHSISTTEDKQLLSIMPILTSGVETYCTQCTSRAGR